LYGDTRTQVRYQYYSHQYYSVLFANYATGAKKIIIIQHLTILAIFSLAGPLSEKEEYIITCQW